MVHGIFRDIFGNPWTSQWVPGLTGLGLPNSGSLDMGNLDSIQNNASKIAAEVSAAQKRWGVDAVNIVAHSKGGIDSREYAKTGTSVEQLLQIGTPNAGSPLADYVQGILILGLGLPNTILVNGLAGPAGYQLTRPYMALYNWTHGHNANVSYDSLAGFYQPNCPSEVVYCILAKIDGDGDLIVPITSVQSLAYAGHLQFPSSAPYNNPEATHFGETGSYSIYSEFLPYLQKFGTPINSNERSTALQAQDQAVRAANRQALLKAKAEASTAAAVPARTFSQTGQIHQGSTATGTIPVDSSTSATLMLIYGSGNLDLTLTAPSGATYTSASANGSTVSYQNGDIPGGRMAAFALTNPETGTWTYKVTGTSVTDPSGATEYSMGAWLEGSSINMMGGFANASIHLGEPLLLEATVTSAGAPFAGATAEASVLLPDGTTSKATLHDDGANGDFVKGDGIYSASFTRTSQAGNYQVVFHVNDTSPAFEREDFQLATVSSSKSSLTGSYTDAGVDSDSDGLYNTLKLTAGVTITKATNYRIFGELTDAKGNVLDTTVEAQLSTSDHTVQFSYDGATLYQRGIDGPYTISRVTLAEDTGTAIMPVDEKLNAYQTAAYKATQFQHAGLTVTGNGTSKGVDLDGNKLYDQLVIDFDVTSAGSGYYYWSGRLSDKNGTAINLAANSGSLNAGTDTIELVFDGKAIGSHGVNGPYQLNDLLLYGPGGSISVGHVINTANYLASQFEGFTTLNPISTGVGIVLAAPASGTPAYGDSVSVTALVQPTAGTGVPTGTATFTLDGAAQSPVILVNGRATFTLALGGGKHTFAAKYSGDVDYAASSSSSLDVTVTQATSATTLALSASTITIQDTSTLTAQIGSTVNGPITGTVTFSRVNSDNTLTPLGTGTVTKDNNGNYVAALSGQSFAIGTYTLQAAYSGDTNYATSTSAKLTLTVTDKADLTLANLPANIALTFGVSGTATASISAVNGFRDPVTLSCGGLPSDVSCEISATGITAGSTVTIKPDSNGTYPSSIQLSVSSTTKAALESTASRNRVVLAAFFPFLIIAILLPAARIRRNLFSLFMAIVLAAAISAVTGCGGGGGHKPENATGTLTLTSSGTHPINHSYSFTVTVK